MTIANHNVRIGRNLYTRGEVITEELTDEKKAWLLKAGAITIVDEDDAPAQADRVTDDGVDAESAATEEAVEAEETEEAVEAAEVPEIDVSDGIVDDEPEPAQAKKTAKKTGKKGGKAVEG